ncbi:Trihelix transcription factor [Actinidia chinensis var. chinensis]|uniref:Trihelix transcription factor n=1 Tax=Actinidia chinensis var. chinensis TaxID=1590841 RepID=A0A2R6QLD8_ACTCC|nr:Trihelix transcription factor [Actinidia chinensis var. chinensis]
MFDGIPEQFHQFIASSRTSVHPLSLSFPLHGSTTQTFPSFDPFPSSHHQPLQLQPHLLPQLHHPPTNHKQEEEREANSFLSTSLELERERSVAGPIDPWSSDEVLALLRIRSSMENWLPDFTWEHVSRKLAGLGYRRSGEMCKDKFEEESRHLNTITTTYTKNYRFFSELEEVCHGENSHVLAQKNPNVENLPRDEADKIGKQVSLEKQDSRNETVNEKMSKGKKRKRGGHHRRFEMLKGFCQEIVNKMMAQQEEMHNKIIEDMVKRDEEKIAREEAWKKQETERINKEIEIRACEQAISGDRQTKLIEYLKHFTSNNPSENSVDASKGSVSSPSPSPSLIQPQNPNPTRHPSNQNPSSLATSPIENPSSSNTQKTPPSPNSEKNEREDIGKRWPRDEVLALINLRCSLNSNSGPNEEKELGAKGPLWKRISQGMLELGYKRSAKRCKEKWENINKYFRKTKDVNKKRSIDSRTCPYFHQLSTLYSQGALVGPLDGPENRSATPENRLENANAEVGEVHPALDFEF